MLKFTYAPRPIPAAIEVAEGHGEKTSFMGAPSLAHAALGALTAWGAPGFIQLLTALQVPARIKAQACYFLMKGPALPYGISAVKSWLQLRKKVLADVPQTSQALQRLHQRVAHYEAVLVQLEEQQARSVEQAIDTWQRIMEMKREYRFFKRERRHGY